MDTTVTVNETQTETVTTEFVPLPRPSDLFQLALARGWKLERGHYTGPTQRSGCAVGALFKAMKQNGLIPAGTYANGQTAHYRAIGAVYPHLFNGSFTGMSGLVQLERGFECAYWSSAECIAFLRGLEQDWED